MRQGQSNSWEGHEGPRALKRAGLGHRSRSLCGNEGELKGVQPGRYAVLAEYGGVYLDLDIQCRRPLDFLRRYPLVMPATRPVGFSNDFLAAAPHHPLMLQMLAALPAWSLPLITKYPTVMFSTGPMFVTLQVRLPLPPGRCCAGQLALLCAPAWAVRSPVVFCQAQVCWVSDHPKKMRA